MPPLEARSQTTKLAISRELLLSGVTTYVDMSYPYPGWLDAVAEAGYPGPQCRPCSNRLAWSRSAIMPWSTSGARMAERRPSRTSCDFLEEVEAHPSGLLTPMMSPMTVDTCTPELLRQAYGVARQRNWPYHIHAGMSVIEFQEMVRRTGLTSIQWLCEQDLLGPTTIVAHGAILDHHSWGPLAYAQGY